MRVIWRKDEEKKVLVPHIEQARCCKEFMGYVNVNRGARRLGSMNGKMTGCLCHVLYRRNVP